MQKQVGVLNPNEALKGRPVVFVLDLDRVIFRTERYYESGRTEFSAYPEDEGALDKIIPLGRLCVFTEITPNGSAPLQRRKLRELGIAELFAEDDIHVSNDKIRDLPLFLDKLKGCFVVLVDDRVEVVEEVRRLASERKNDPEVFGVWLERGPHAEVARKQRKDEKFDVDAIVRNLNDFTIKVLIAIGQRVQGLVVATK